MSTVPRNPAPTQLALPVESAVPSPQVTKRPPLMAAGLFAGIGGIELGLARSGHNTSLLCEIDELAQEVLRHRFPDAKLADDVTKLEGLPSEVELLTGGFPCQDLSQAGQTAGIEGLRSGLVAEVFRLLRARRVPWLILENVSFMLSLHGGRALAVIVDELERLGYSWAYRVVDSRAFGVPQRRERVFLVASTVGDPRGVLFADEAGEPAPRRTWPKGPCGFYWTEGVKGLGWAEDAVPTLKGGSGLGIPSPPAIVWSDGSVVTPDIRDAERMQGFPADWTLPVETIARRGRRWKLVGNAVTVNVAEWIGRRLREPGEPVPFESHLISGPGRWPDAAWNVGDGRYSASLSRWPLHVDRPALSQFLEFPTAPLSVRATAGFLTRAARGQLRFPAGFLDAVRAHLESVSKENGLSSDFAAA